MEKNTIFGLFLMLILIPGCNLLPDCEELNLSESEQGRLRCHSYYYILNNTDYLCKRNTYGEPAAMPLSEHCYLEGEPNVSSEWIHVNLTEPTVVKDYGLQFEEIPIGSIYCDPETEYISSCSWYKGSDGMYRRTCYGAVISREICYNKTEFGKILISNKTISIWS